MANSMENPVASSQRNGLANNASSQSSRDVPMLPFKASGQARCDDAIDVNDSGSEDRGEQSKVSSREMKSYDDESGDDNSRSGRPESDSDSQSASSDNGIDGASGSDSGSGTDDDSGSENEGNAKQGALTSADGHVLSAYEIQRLERIRRNQEYLSQLGLEKRSESESRPRKRKRQKEKPAQTEKRESLRSRKLVDYSEPATTVASIVRATKNEAVPRRKRAKENTGQDRKKDVRMERFIYREFKAIQAHKNHVLRQAEKQVKAAKREVKYWSKLAARKELKERRREESIHNAKAGEKKSMNLKDLLRDIDNRTTELANALNDFDEEVQEEERSWKQDVLKRQIEKKLTTLHAMDRFPVARKESELLLNSLLLQRVPDDPPPRRSQRSTRDYSGDGRPTNQLVPALGPCTTKSSYWNDVESIHPISQCNDTSLERIPKNVGGWVSPAFAAHIDRSWLERDANLPDFDPATYVPQVGECVLYYPLGHKYHLSYYPDNVGKASGNNLRVPLWERDGEGGVNGERGAGRWLSPTWLSQVRNDSWNYPILCRVERSYAEFPPDPYTKVIKVSNEGEKVSWIPPKDPIVLKRIRGTPLALAVDLRPMTALHPFIEKEVPLEPPPIFSIVTFPTELDPFLVPFPWAYACQSLTVGDPVVRVGDDHESELRVESFSTIPGTELSCRLDCYIASIEYIVSLLDGATQGEALHDILSNAPTEFPARDARAVIEVFRHFLASNDITRRSDHQDGVLSSDLFAIVSRTLPLWNGASVVRSVNKRKALHVSPWLLLPPGTSMLHHRCLPNCLAVTSGALDESLRANLRFAIEDVASRNDDSGTFYFDITEEVAPSYCCAVPLMMSIEKILRRLGMDKPGSYSYYRSVDALLSDVALILDNCLLYNSPDSAVADSAVLVVSELKASLLLTAQHHCQGMINARRADENRRRFLFNCVDMKERSTVNSALFPQAPVAHEVRCAHRDEVEQQWLQLLIPTDKGSVASTCHQKDRFPWYPQAGDKVLYAKGLHESFVSAHGRCLEPGHCLLPPISTNENAIRSVNQEHDSQHWFLGTVMWARGVFPRCRSTAKKIKTDDTFSASATILCVCVKFDAEAKPSLIYWRPCLRSSDHVQLSCPHCGLSNEFSFLRPSSNAPLELPDSDVTSLVRCLNFLKQRCIKQEKVATVDAKLTVTNVKNGYVVAPARVGTKSLTTFEDLFTYDFHKSAGVGLGINTRGASSSRDLDPALPVLVDAGFLPPWATTSINAAVKELERHKMVSSWPQMSLELILHRLRHRFYRHKAAVQNDIIEAYINQVILLVSDAAGRRKSPVSLKRLAQILACPQLLAADGEFSESAVPEEECGWAMRMCKVRELHALALVAANETAVFETIFGLSQTRIESSSKPTVHPARALARSKIETLLLASNRELTLKSLNRPVPKAVSIRCDGRIVARPKYFSPVSRTIAEYNGRTRAVKVICNGKDYSSFVEVTQPNEDELNVRGRSLPSSSLPEVRVKVLCNGVSVGSVDQRSLTAFVPGLLGKSNLKRVVERSIKLSKKDFEECETLVRFLAGEPGKVNPCMRCQVYNRSFYQCRVMRRHDNIDFDWSASLSDSSLVDSLLASLDLKKAAVATMAADNTCLSIAPKISTDPADKHCSTVTQVDAGAHSTIDLMLKDSSAHGESADQADHIKFEEQKEKASGALQLATDLLHAATTYSNAPHRLSPSFIRGCFPVDPSDGHYIYCVICGLSGNLVCCDGCANVFHQDCVALQRIPDGDWFCDECLLRNRPSTENADGGDATRNLINDATNAAETSSPKRAHDKLLFGRVAFDDGKAVHLSNLLRELKAARPDQKSTRGEDFEDSREVLDNLEKRRHGRPRKVATVDPSLKLASSLKGQSGRHATMQPCGTAHISGNQTLVQHENPAHNGSTDNIDTNHTVRNHADAMTDAEEESAQNVDPVRKRLRERSKSGQVNGSGKTCVGGRRSAVDDDDSKKMDFKATPSLYRARSRSRNLSTRSSGDEVRPTDGDNVAVSTPVPSTRRKRATAQNIAQGPFSQAPKRQKPSTHGSSVPSREGEGLTKDSLIHRSGIATVPSPDREKRRQWRRAKVKTPVDHDSDEQPKPNQPNLRRGTLATPRVRRETAILEVEWAHNK